MMKSLQETFEALKVSNCKEARQQKKILAASVTSLEYGVPEHGLTSREVKEVVKMKERLMSGEDNIIKVPEKTVRQSFPEQVHYLASKHWEEITVTEPSKHRYVSKAVKDGKETRPTQYQTMTNQETYESFKENCSKEVSEIMLIHSEEMAAIYEKRKDLPDKNYRINYAREVLLNKFPSFSWWPCEVKTMHNHTTALCKVKYSS